MGLIRIEYGGTYISLNVPLPVDERKMTAVTSLENPEEAVLESFEKPTGTLPLREIVRAKLALKPDARAVVVVSDYTRPVPYRGKEGILAPLLRTMTRSGIVQERITVLIGCGSHRKMEEDEIERMLGLNESGFAVPVVQHEYENENELVFVGKTGRNSPVKINRTYCEADIKIVTGLVESHFMAGASGGRKAVCPGIAGRKTLEIFHGPETLGSPRSADLILDGNPCHEEALQAARLAGCDFCVNVTLDSEKRLTGVFSGEIEAAHIQAVDRIREYVVVGIEKKYDLVIAPAGFVGVNHYQAAKAAVAASRAVRRGGMILLVARHTDPDPVGSGKYRKTLALLKQQGHVKFLKTLKSPEWTFLHDQWETQMWGKVLGVIGSEENLLYCSLEIPDEEYCILPCTPAVRMVKNIAAKKEGGDVAAMEEVAARAARYAVERITAERGRIPEALFLPDGPYGVPELIGV